MLTANAGIIMHMINVINFVSRVVVMKKFLIFVLMSACISVFAKPQHTNRVVVPAEQDDAIGSMLLQAVSLMGIPYRWGGNTPDSGMDCSGFIRYVFQYSLGITLPRTAAEMARLGKTVSIKNLEPGDLLFFNTRRGSNTHVGMYLGRNKFIVAPRTGRNISIEEFDSSYRAVFNGAKRIVQENEDNTGNTVLENYQSVTDQPLPVKYRKKQLKRKNTHKSRHLRKVTKIKSHRHRRMHKR
jgi:cell wall-associated NlpC family hydrolase